MRILLDECLPRRLKREFGAGHLVLTVPEAGWAGTKNGRLIALAASSFDVFVTTDTSLKYQQNLSAKSLIIVVLLAISNDIALLSPLIPAVLDVLARAKPGEVIRVGG